MFVNVHIVYAVVYAPGFTPPFVQSDVPSVEWVITLSDYDPAGCSIIHKWGGGERVYDIVGNF